MATMADLNKVAAEAMQAVGVSACTDVTGFGLLGHLLEMMLGSDASAVVRTSQVKLLPGALGFATSGVVPGGSASNMEHTSGAVEYDAKVPEVKRLLLNDAQTSGGLLIAVPRAGLDELVDLLQEGGIEPAVIGSVGPGADPRIRVGP
jgi:selenide,water dikinase